jgi:hypothetical protein
MSSWTPDDLRIVADTDDLFVSPFRADGTTYGTPTRVWALVVDGQVYARAAHGQESSWYQAAITQHAGRVRVADRTYDVTFARANAAIDAAYETKCPGSLSVATMQGIWPTAATVKVTLR